MPSWIYFFHFSLVLYLNISSSKKLENFQGWNLWPVYLSHKTESERKGMGKGRAISQFRQTPNFKYPNESPWKILWHTCDRLREPMSVIIKPLRFNVKAQCTEGAPVNLSTRLRTFLLAEHGETECQISYSADIYNNWCLVVKGC